jgi:hypothetical protein
VHEAIVHPVIHFRALSEQRSLSARNASIGPRAIFNGAPFSIFSVRAPFSMAFSAPRAPGAPAPLPALPFCGAACRRCRRFVVALCDTAKRFAAICGVGLLFTALVCALRCWFALYSFCLLFTALAPRRPGPCWIPRGAETVIVPLRGGHSSPPGRLPSIEARNST